MKLLSQPRILAPRVGASWLAQGFRLFHRQPLGWTLILFIYWAGMLMLAFIPIFGMLLPLLIAPGLALGFIEIARAIDEQRTPAPPLLISAFRSPRAKAVLVLGSWYVLEIAAIMLITLAIDGGTLLEWITTGQPPVAEDIAGMRTASVVAALLYVPVMMAFWFAPQLVVWSEFSPIKALFFSFFAVWRNRGAFFRYLITWIGLTVFVGASVALLDMAFDFESNTMGTLLFPLTLILMAIAHGSFYASTKDIFFAQTPDSATHTTTD